LGSDGVEVDAFGAGTGGIISGCGCGDKDNVGIGGACLGTVCIVVRLDGGACLGAETPAGYGADTVVHGEELAGLGTAAAAVVCW
jgi:hypothetical protein